MCPGIHRGVESQDAASASFSFIHIIWMVLWSVFGIGFVVPLEVSLDAFLSLSDKFLLLRIAESKLCSASATCVYVHRPMPVIAVKVLICLNVHYRLAKRIRIVTDVLYVIMLWLFPLPDHSNLSAAIQAEAQRLFVVDVSVSRICQLVVDLLIVLSLSYLLP